MPIIIDENNHSIIRLFCKDKKGKTVVIVKSKIPETILNFIPFIISHSIIFI